MRVADIKKLSTEEINKKVVELKKELFNLRFQLAVGQLENTAKIGQVKKTIAQMKTIVSQRGLE